MRLRLASEHGPRTVPRGRTHAGPLRSNPEPYRELDPIDLNPHVNPHVSPHVNAQGARKNPLSHLPRSPAGPRNRSGSPRPPAEFRRRPPAARRAETRRRSASAPDGAGPKFGAAPAGAPRGPGATPRDVAEVPHRTGRPRAPAKRGALVRLGRQPGPGLGPRGGASGPDRAGARGGGARRPDTTGAEPSAAVYVASVPPPPPLFRQRVRVGAPGGQSEARRGRARAAVIPGSPGALPAADGPGPVHAPARRDWAHWCRSSRTPVRAVERVWTERER